MNSTLTQSAEQEKYFECPHCGGYYNDSHTLLWSKKREQAEFYYGWEYRQRCKVIDYLIENFNLDEWQENFLSSIRERRKLLTRKQKFWYAFIAKKHLNTLVTCLHRN